MGNGFRRIALAQGLLAERAASGGLTAPADIPETTRPGATEAVQAPAAASDRAPEMRVASAA